MRIQELVGTSVASGIAKHLKQMLMKPTRIKYNADSKRYEIRSDDFIINLIAYRDQMGLSGGVHPITMLGLYTTPRLVGALFSNKGFVDAIRTFDAEAEPGSDDNPLGLDNNIGGYYNRPGRSMLGYGKRKDPSKGHIGLNRILADYAVNSGKMSHEELAGILAHEYMHRGLAMSNWNQGIKKYINGIMLRPPYDAWGSSDAKETQFDASESMGRRQYATLEHMMIYAYEKFKKARNEYITRNHHKVVPGFEEFPSWIATTDSEGNKSIGAETHALGLLNLIGKGVEQYMIKTAQEINNIPEQDLDEMIYFWATKRGIK